MTEASIPWEFGRDMSDLRRLLEGVGEDARPGRFQECAAEGIRWHTVRGLDKQIVVDRLAEIGEAINLDADTVQSAIATAVAKPFFPNAARWISASPPTTASTPFDWRKQVSSAAALQSMTFPPVSYVVPDLVPEGLSLLAGKPKIGKSWLALDLCLAVAGGRYCLGERMPVVGDALYCALEDNPRRLQRRITKLIGIAKEPWPPRLRLATQWRRLDKGGVDDLAEWVESSGAPRFIILDTLAGVRPIKTNAGYTDDYESLAALHRLANEKGVAILVLHHTRKMEADDPVDTVSGTLGLSGCADTILVLTRSSKGTTLYVRGRDIEEAEHAVEFQKDACRWTILGDAAAVQRSAERGRILEALGGSTEPMGPTDIAGATGMKVNNVKFLLHKMVAAGEVKQPARGQYLAG